MSVLLRGHLRFPPYARRSRSPGPWETTRSGTFARDIVSREAVETILVIVARVAGAGWITICVNPPALGRLGSQTEAQLGEEIVMEMAEQYEKAGGRAEEFIVEFGDQGTDFREFRYSGEHLCSPKDLERLVEKEVVEQRTGRAFVRYCCLDNDGHPQGEAWSRFLRAADTCNKTGCRVGLQHLLSTDDYYDHWAGDNLVDTDACIVRMCAGDASKCLVRWLADPSHIQVHVSRWQVTSATDMVGNPISRPLGLQLFREGVLRQQALKAARSNASGREAPRASGVSRERRLSRDEKEEANSRALDSEEARKAAGSSLAGDLSRGLRDELGVGEDSEADFGALLRERASGQKGRGSERCAREEDVEESELPPPMFPTKFPKGGGTGLGDAESSHEPVGSADRSRAKRHEKVESEGRKAREDDSRGGIGAGLAARASALSKGEEKVKAAKEEVPSEDDSGGRVRRKGSSSSRSSGGRSSRAENEDFRSGSRGMDSVGNLARLKPGYLLRSGLRGINSLMGERVLGARNVREMQTLALALDALLDGRLESVGEILFQRLKAIDMAIGDGMREKELLARAAVRAKRLHDATRVNSPSPFRRAPSESGRGSALKVRFKEGPEGKREAGVRLQSRSRSRIPVNLRGRQSLSIDGNHAAAEEAQQEKSEEDGEQKKARPSARKRRRAGEWWKKQTAGGQGEASASAAAKVANWAPRVVTLPKWKAEAAAAKRTALKVKTSAVEEDSTSPTRQRDVLPLWHQEETVQEVVQGLEERGVSKRKRRAAEQDQWEAGARLTYTGEVTCAAERLSLAQVVPGLPPEIKDLVIPKARVLVEDLSEWYSIAAEMVQRRIGKPIAESEIFVAQGRRLLNGAFGVRKAGQFLEDGRPVLRLIMALRPANIVMRQIPGGMATLIGSAGWGSLRVQVGEEFLISGDDLTCAFYLFRIPDCWSPFLAFELPVPWAALGVARGLTTYIASTILPMDWGSSAGVMQAVGRYLALSPGPGGAGADPMGELRRGQLGGDERLRWSIYLDDLTVLRKIVALWEKGKRGQIDALQILLRQAYDYHGIPWSQDKAVEGVSKAERLGAVLDGEVGRLGPVTQRQLDLLQLAVWLIGARFARLRHLRFYAGRDLECRCIRCRRCLFSAFDSLWSLIASGGPRGELPWSVAVEMLVSSCLTPARFYDFRSRVVGEATVSDASEYGGDFCVSRNLSAAGRREAEEVQAAGSAEGTGSPAEALTRAFLARAEYRGSDIRLDLQTQLEDLKLHRVGINPDRWEWKVVTGWPWKRDNHINILELRAYLAVLAWRGRSSERHHTTWLYLIDSQVALSVAVKRRSSSRALN
ncbi:unnamed protein product, partial [Polarella glacialis]